MQRKSCLRLNFVHLAAILDFFYYMESTGHIKSYPIRCHCAQNGAFVCSVTIMLLRASTNFKTYIGRTYIAFLFNSVLLLCILNEICSNQPILTVFPSNLEPISFHRSQDKRRSRDMETITEVEYLSLTRHHPSHHPSFPPPHPPHPSSSSHQQMIKKMSDSQTETDLLEAGEKEDEIGAIMDCTPGAEAATGDSLDGGACGGLSRDKGPFWGRWKFQYRLLWCLCSL